MRARRVIEFGSKIGRWTLVSEAAKRGKNRMVLCRCDCGTERVVRLLAATGGKTNSCGCIASDRMASLNWIHGHAIGRKTLTYRTWISMVGRCTIKGYVGYEVYGGAGITVCERWLVFENFLADMGERSSRSMTIDRIDNSLGYEPNNCRWATKRQQTINRTITVMVEYDGVKVALCDLAVRFGMKVATVKSRMKSGWSLQKSLTHPLRITKPPRKRKQSHGS